MLVSAQPPSPWRVVFFKDSRGRSPIVEYLNMLPFAEQVAAQEAFSLMREFGLSLGMPHAKHINGKLWELRPGANRFFNLPMSVGGLSFCTPTVSRARRRLRRNWLSQSAASLKY
jgi:hypothetical protein